MVFTSCLQPSQMLRAGLFVPAFTLSVERRYDLLGPTRLAHDGGEEPSNSAGYAAWLSLPGIPIRSTSAAVYAMLAEVLSYIGLPNISLRAAKVGAVGARLYQNGRHAGIQVALRIQLFGE